MRLDEFLVADAPVPLAHVSGPSAVPQNGSPESQGASLNAAHSSSTCDADHGIEGEVPIQTLVAFLSQHQRS